MVGVEETRRVLERWRGGESAAGEALVRRCSPGLLRSARRFLGRTSLALAPEDLVQGTWERVFRAGVLEAFVVRRSGAFVAWLQRILQRTALDELRRQRTCMRSASVGDPGSVGLSGGSDFDPSQMSTASSDPSPTSRARYRELTELCRAALSPREWEVWRRVEIECVPAVDVAAALDLSPSAVRALVFRARGKVLQVLRCQE